MALKRNVFSALFGIAAVAALVTALPAQAQRDWPPGPPGHPQHAAPPRHAAPPPPPSYRQPPKYRRELVYDYFAKRQEPYRSLPPHIARQIRPGAPLPSGISYQPLPRQLSRQLHFCGNGWECVVVGADMVIIDSRRGVVAEVLPGVRR